VLQSQSLNVSDQLGVY